MAEKTDNFLNEQQRAVERMREMNRRSQMHSQNMPPVPPFVRTNREQQRNNTPPPKSPPESPSTEEKSSEKSKKTGSSIFETILSGFSSSGGPEIDLPFIGKIKADPDMALILGLLLILWSEKSDRLLLMALLYILI